MTNFETKPLPAKADTVAPDGSHVRVLLQLHGGGMAHFELAAGETSIAVMHRTVEEAWYVVGGQGEMWRKRANREEIVWLEPGICVTIPLGTHFQFRSSGPGPLEIVAATMPSWPGAQEAVRVPGRWTPHVATQGECSTPGSPSS